MGDLIAAIVVLVFILFDFITGLIKAYANKNLSSTKMREGLLHKVAFVLVLLLGWLCEFATPILGLPEPFGAIYYGVAVYIVLTEICSIIENLGEMNPELTSSGIISLFDVEKKEEK